MPETDSLILGGPEASATAEALAVAAVYNRPAVLTGAAATRSRFIAEAPSRSIVHMSAQTRCQPRLSRCCRACCWPTSPGRGTPAPCSAATSRRKPCRAPDSS